MDKALRTAGAILAVVGGALLIIWADGRNTDRHGGVFVFFAGALIALVGGSLCTLGYALRRRDQISRS